MPQLNPGPWLMTFLMTWLAYMAIFLVKTQSTPLQNSPIPSIQTKQKTSEWTWPWP
uniref:ATP synthase complex subunit 8 n=1 Tax=Barisia rudicollis TaxID=290744 RepID=H6VUN4_9SAUR|nr:ATPase8 [Barisia rudicollis]